MVFTCDNVTSEKANFEMTELIPVATWDGPSKLNVVFVHGLGGHPYETWRSENESGSFWPKWLAEDIGGLNVFTLSYEAPATKWLGGSMPLEDRAASFWACLRSEPRILNTPTVFICHSLGGLIVKRLMVNLSIRRGNDPDAAAFLDHVRRVFFIATPHTGSDVASLASRIGYLIWPSRMTRVMVANSPTLRHLNLSFRALSLERETSLKCHSYYETRDTSEFRVVAEDSSDPGLAHTIDPIPLDANHISITKLHSRNDLLYKDISNWIRKDIDDDLVGVYQFAKEKSVVRSRIPVGPQLVRLAVAFGGAVITTAGLFPGGVPQITGLILDAPAAVARLITCSVDSKDYRKFFDAIEDSDVAIVSTMREQCYDPNQTNEVGISALALAAKSDNQEVLNVLSTSRWPRPRADFEAIDEERNNVLHYAAQSCSKNSIEFLLKREPHLAGRQNSRGHNPGTLALSNCPPAIYELIRNLGARNDQSVAPIFFAAYADETSAQVEKQVVDDFRIIIELNDKVALNTFFSSEKANGVDGNTQVRGGRTAIMLAATRGLTEALAVLIRKTEKLDYATEDGETALMLAAGLEVTESIELLTSAQASIRDGNGSTSWLEGLRQSRPDVWLSLNDYRIHLGQALGGTVERGEIESARALVRAGANPFDERIDGRNESALVTAAKLENGDLANSISRALISSAHQEDRTQLKDDIFLNAIWRQGSQNGSLLFVLISEEVVPNDLGLVLRVLLNTYKTNGAAWNPDAIAALLNIDKPLYQGPNVEKAVLSTLTSAIVGNTSAPNTPSKVREELDRFLARGLDISAEAQPAIELLFSAIHHPDDGNKVEFETKRRVAIDWLVEQNAPVTVTDEMFRDAYQNKQQHLLTVLALLGPNSSRAERVFQNLYLAASEGDEPVGFWVKRLDLLIDSGFQASPDLGEFILRRFLIWEHPSNGELALEFWDRRLVSETDAGENPKVQVHASDKIENEPCRRPVLDARNLLDRLLRARSSFAEAEIPAGEMTSETVGELDLLIQGLVARGYQFSSALFFGCAYLKGFGEPNHLQNEFPPFPIGLADRVINDSLYLSNEVDSEKIVEMMWAARGTDQYYGHRETGDNAPKPIDEVSGFGVETIDPKVIIALIDLAIAEAGNNRTEEFNENFSHALGRAPFIYAPDNDRDQILLRLLENTTNVHRGHLFTILDASDMRRQGLVDVFEAVANRTDERVVLKQLRWFRILCIDDELLAVVARTHNVSRAQVCG